MRIAIWHNLPSGGGKRALYDQVRALVAHGHSVTAWCPDTANRSFLPLQTLIEERCLPTGLATAQATGLARLSMEVRTKRAMTLHARACASEIREGGFDILLAHACRFYHSPHIGRYVDVPAVLYLQEPKRGLYEWLPRLPWPAAFPSEGLKERMKLPLKVYFARRLVRDEIMNARAFRRILCNSYFSRENIARAYGLDAHVCYLGVDTDIFLPLINSAPKPSVICVGAFIPAKDPELLVRAVALLPSPRPVLNWFANHVDDSLSQEMQELARSLRVELHLHQLASDRDLVAALNSSSLLAYAPRLEPFGYAPLEANACAIPAVGVREGGVRETINHEETGILTERDPASLAEGMSRLLADGELRRALGKKARDTVMANWTLEAASARLIRQLEAVLAQ